MFFPNVLVAIAIYGFSRNLSPDSSYLSDIFFSPPKSFSSTEVTQDMSALLVYSKLLFTIVVFMVTDVLQYKTVLITGIISSISSGLMLYFGTTIVQIQAMFILDGIFKASAVAYYSFIYTQVKKQTFTHMTSLIYIAPKVGTLLSGVLAQLLLSVYSVDLSVLVIINIAGKCLGLAAGLYLPPVTGTVFSAITTAKGIDDVKGSLDHKTFLSLLWEELSMAMSNKHTMKCSLWWIITQGGFSLVTSYYVQCLWNEISEGRSNEYNGGVDAAMSCLSSIACLVIGKLPVDWRVNAELFNALGTLISGAMLVANGYSTSLVASYCFYIGYICVHDIVYVVISSQVMLQVKNDSFGFLYGINTFLSFGLQALLTYLLTSKNAFALPIREQFVLVGYVLAFSGLMLLASTLYESVKFTDIFTTTNAMSLTSKGKEDKKIVINSVAGTMYSCTIEGVSYLKSPIG